MRTQRPIIVADSIAFRDLTKEVLKIDKPTIQKISHTIELLWKNESVGKKLVEKANEFLRNNSWDKVASQHIKV